MKILFTSLFLFILCSQGFAQQVYITKTGEKYHEGTCRYLSRSKIPKDLKDVIDYYDACKVCKPPATVSKAVKKSPAKKTSPVKKPAYVPAKKRVPAKSKATSVQCSGRTKAGARCKRMTTSSSGKCYQHD